MPARAQIGVFDTLDDAGERLDERGVPEIGFRPEPQQVLLDEPRRNGDGFRVSAIQKKQVFAKIFLPGPAMKAFAARRGIGHGHAVADAPSQLRTAIPQLGKRASQFVAENGGRHNHFGVITPFEYF